MKKGSIIIYLTKGGNLFNQQTSDTFLDNFVDEFWSDFGGLEVFVADHLEGI